MAPGRFAKADRRRDVTPYREEAAPASVVPMRPTTPHPDRQGSVDREIYDRPVTPAPAEWTSVDAPINFTWVIPDELCGMGWPKSRDQVRFLTEQGIEHLVTLSPEKIPPHYAFPDLQHTLIPVEDFTGPTIAEIQKFIEITDEARKEGMAVGVHCAEGRGRTGVMCACYLIYYYDMDAWDAIRIMRRQRPGSVERKVQEETVVRFYNLLQDYGKSSVEKLEEREKQLIELQKKQQAELIRNDDFAAKQATMNLLSHMHSFHTRQTNEAKQERVSRMRRARSVPKMEDEEEMNAVKLKSHIQALLQGDRQKRSRSQHRRNTEEEESDNDRMSRATTPGRSLLEVNLKPVKDRPTTLPSQVKVEEKCELKNHFRDFMNSPLKRGRSFSQPRDKEQGGGTPTSLSRKESFEQKYVQDSMEQENGELANHTKRFLKRKSMINTNKNSDESDNDIKDKPSTPDNKDQSENEEEGVTKIAAKPPPFKSLNELKTQRRLQRNTAERRNRSKSDVTVPKIYDMFEDKKPEKHEETPDQEVEIADEKPAEVNGETETVTTTESDNVTGYDAVYTNNVMNNVNDEVDNLTENVNNLSVSSVKDETVDESEKSDVVKVISREDELELSLMGYSLGDIENFVVEKEEPKEVFEPEIAYSEPKIQQEPSVPRIRKLNSDNSNDFCYVSTKLTVTNSKPKPFVASPIDEKDPPVYYRRFSKESTTSEASTPSTNLSVYQSSAQEVNTQAGDDHKNSYNYYTNGNTIETKYSYSNDNQTEVNNDYNTYNITTNGVDYNRNEYTSERKKSDGNSERRRSRDKRSIDKENKDRKNSDTSRRVRENKYYDNKDTNYVRRRSTIHTDNTDREGKTSLDYTSKYNYNDTSNRKTSLDQSSSSGYYSSSRKSSLDHQVGGQQDHMSGRKSSLDQGLDNKQYQSYDGDRQENGSSYYSSSTSEMMKACKSGLRRLTYRKTYARTKSNTDMEQLSSQDKNNNSTGDSQKYDCARGVTYTRMASGIKHYRLTSDSYPIF